MDGDTTGAKLTEWINSSNLPRNLFACWFVPWMAFTARYPVGRNIYNAEWDLLVVLDACRYDALQSVADEYVFLDEVERAVSVGSSSKEWLVNTFRREHLEDIKQTTYLTGNAWVDEALVESVDFSSWTVTKGSVADSNNYVHGLLSRPTVSKKEFNDVWLQTVHSIDDIDAFPAKDLTNYTVRYGRERDPERTVVHYMQPHAPYLHRWAEGKSLRDIDTEPFEHIKKGGGRKPVWEAYLNNLRYVLDHVGTLLDNYDAENVVITADHGEMFGPLLYSHGEGIPHPKLRVVPWVTTSAVDRETTEPEIDLENDSKIDVDERLEALGYK